MIDVRELEKSYHDREVLRGIQFRIQEGETVGFLGPNGAGKTTTMRILVGLLLPDKGAVEIAGIDVLRKPRQVAPLLGYLPDQPPLYLEMRVREYLTFVAQLKGLKGVRLQDRVQETLVEADLHLVSEVLIRKLSRGFRQRVGLAQALVAEPRLLILDEPTTGLDPVQARRTRNLIKTLKGRTTILFSSHNLAEVEEVADRVLLLDRGRIVVDQATGALSQAANAGRYRLVFKFPGTPPAELIDWVKQVPGAQAVTPGRREEGHVVYLKATSPDAVPGLLEISREKQLPLVEISPWPRTGLETAFFQFLDQEVA